MSTLTTYTIARQREFKALVELRARGIKAHVPTRLIRRRTRFRDKAVRVPSAPGYLLTTPACNAERVTLERTHCTMNRIGASRIEDALRLYERSRMNAKASANPFTIGQHVTVGEVPGVVASTDGDSCVVAVTLIGKQHLLKPLHYDRLRPG